MASARKIINDPVYGFITIDHPFLLQLIAHPFYQRLRRISQMALSHLVYPGAMHTRLHHSLGAFHLMCGAITELRSKGIEISEEEELGAKIAILLHDIGHGPYSHALENELIQGVQHERISRRIMDELNREFGGKLDLAIAIFSNQYPKQFLHQLVSGQLDMDRMDYLSRDSFFTGVAEGVISYDRILKMLTVQNDQLMIEEKGIYSIEKFLVARRLMYWQVYLHKTVVSAEQLLVRIMKRARQLIAEGRTLVASTFAFDYFLQQPGRNIQEQEQLAVFCQLDDADVMSTIKNWMQHEDKILSILCRCLVERKLFKINLQSEPFAAETVDELRKLVIAELDIDPSLAHYFVFTGVAVNTTYNSLDERINILFKDGSVRDISEVDNALIHQQLSGTVTKNYLCYYRS